MRPIPLVLLLAACAGATDDGVDPDGPAHGAVIATVADDYSVGALATVDVDDWSVDDEIVPIAGDAAVSASGGHVFQINRFNHDTVRIYEPGDWTVPRAEFSVGELANPQDVEMCDGKVFVSLYGRDFVGVYDLDGEAVGTVDLAPWADADGLPESTALVLTRDGLFLALNRLDRDAGWVDAGGGVVRIDCAAEEVVASWDIGANTSIHPWGDDVLVTAGALGDAASGLYDLDGSLLVDASDGRFGGVVALGTTAVATRASGDDYTVECLDLAAGTRAVIETPRAFLTAAVGNDRGEAWVAARDHWADPGFAGVLVFDVATCTNRTGAAWLSTTLAPYDIAFY